MTDMIKEAITEHWGERCADHEPGCPVCDAWAEYDVLTRVENKPDGIGGTSTDTSTAAVEARCQHLDHCAHDRKSADAELMRALVAERDDALAALDAEKFANAQGFSAAYEAGERDGRKEALEEVDRATDAAISSISALRRGAFSKGQNEQGYRLLCAHEVLIGIKHQHRALQHQKDED